MFLYAGLGVLCICASVLYFRRNRKTVSLLGQHFMITGGSLGIGKAFAEEVVERGASVTLLARNKERLDAVKSHLLSAVISSQQKIITFAVDVSADSQTLKDAVKQAESEVGPITCLVNCAGTSACYRFDETPDGEFERMLNINVLGSVYITRAVIPFMKQRRSGNIIFFSSLAGLLGIYGYTAYCASKFAVIGMAQALDMEVKPYGIGITVSVPSDTDTPGYAEEMKSKLLETKLVCESAGLFNARDVARRCLNDAMNKKFLSYLGIEGWMLSSVSGASPASYLGLITQVFTTGILQLVAYCYKADCDRKIAKVFRSKE